MEKHLEMHKKQSVFSMLFWSGNDEWKLQNRSKLCIQVNF